MTWCLVGVSQYLRRAPSIAAATIFVFACPSQQATLNVRVIESVANPVPIGGARVSVGAGTTNAMTNGFGKAVLSNLAPGTVVVRALLIGYCPGTVTVTLVAGTTQSVDVPLCGPTSDHLTVNGNTSNDNTVALVDARMIPLSTVFVGDPPCQDDVLLRGISSVALIDNAVPADFVLPACHSAATVFSEGSPAVHLEGSAPLPWTTTQGDNVPVQLLANRLKIPTVIWIADPAITPTKRTDISAVHVPDANDLLRTSKVGMELVGDGVAGAPQLIDVSTALITTIGDFCNPTIAATPAIYQKDYLNVYYVKTIATNEVGYSCFAEGGPNIIFMMTTAGGPYALAHEVGHALGLQSPFWGHTEYLAGFSKTTDGAFLNLMAHGAVTPDHVTVGQAYRMNLGANSWVNLTLSGGTSLRQGLFGGTPFTVSSCACPPPNAVPECPPLILDLDRGYTLSGDPGFKPTCEFSGPPSLAVNDCTAAAAVPVTVELYYDLASNVRGGGKAGWVSLDPTVLTVDTPEGTTPMGQPNTRANSLTGKKTGGTWVRLAVEGPSLTIPVIVGGPSCP